MKKNIEAILRHQRNYLTDLKPSKQKHTALQFTRSIPDPLTHEMVIGGNAVNALDIIQRLRTTCQIRGMRFLNHLPDKKLINRYGSKSSLHKRCVESLERD